jgi:aldehyde:ferredoxin oxidoreductase
VEGKGALTMWNQDARTAVGDCPTMCIFMLDTSVAPFLFENTAGLMTGATGMEFTGEDVRRVGERVNNVARAYNILAGLTRADDDLPARLKEEPIPEGPAKGHLISQADLDLMLDEYYEARGWTPDGVPTRARLDELRLGDVADRLGVE